MKRSLALLTCLALLTTAPAAIAQDDPAPKSSTASNAAAARRPPAPADSSEPRTFNLAFPGGTVAQYAEAVRKATGGAANIVVNPDAADVTVPAFSIAAVDLQAAMKLLQGRGTQRPGRVIGIEEISADEANAQPVFVIETYDRVGPDRRPHVPPDTSCVWSLSPIVDSGKKLEDVLSAIEAALSMFPEDEPRPKVRLHKETGLLIACGDGPKLAAINAVVKALTPPQPPGASDYEALRADIEKLREQVEKLQAQNRAPASTR